MGNERAVDHMLQYGIIKDRKSLETELMLNENGGIVDDSIPL